MRNSVLTVLSYSLFLNDRVALGFTACPSFGVLRTINKVSPLNAESTLEGRVIEGALRPLNNFVLVKVAEAVEKTDGGILLTGKAKIVKTEGSVVACGPGKTHSESGIFFPMPVAPGDGVVYGKYDGTGVEYNGEKHALIRDEDILVKFEEKLSMDSAEMINDNILVKVETPEAIASTGGLLIAATVGKDTRPSTGTVIKVGPGKMASDGSVMVMDVEIGDMVKFRDFAGNEVFMEDEEFSVVKMVDILAKF